MPHIRESMVTSQRVVDAPICLAWCKGFPMYSVFPSVGKSVANWRKPCVFACPVKSRVHESICVFYGYCRNMIMLRKSIIPMNRPAVNTKLLANSLISLSVKLPNIILLSFFIAFVFFYLRYSHAVSAFVSPVSRPKCLYGLSLFFIFILIMFKLNTKVCR